MNERQNRKRYIKIFSLLLLTIFIATFLSDYSIRADENESKPLIQITADYTVFNRIADIQFKVDSLNDINTVKYVRGKVTNINSDKWLTKSKDITGKSNFKVKKAGNYSIMAEDVEGNREIFNIKVVLEFKAVWFAYYDYVDSNGRVASSKQDFINRMDNVFTNVKNMGMNAVVVHVRSHGDAMYPSKYYPWSRYASGTQGVSPGYDPLEIMVDLAHKHGLEFHAWLNPYRISTRNTDVKALSKNNQARKWLEDNNPDNDRNVLALHGNLYYNPSSAQVRKLITNGIKEIINNYDVDGIHLDDYFYPDLIGDNKEAYKSLFDAPEYEIYKQGRLDKGKKTYMDIADWRRNNVNKLLSGIYKAVKNYDSSIVFGVSPGGFLDHLTKVDRYYVDYPTWLSKNGYMDYICPQVYWSYDKNNTFPYAETVDRWIAARASNSNVKIYVGIAAYKAGSSKESIKEDGWQDTDILKNMIITARSTKKIDGFIFFDYADMVSKNKTEYVNTLLEELSK